MGGEGGGEGETRQMFPDCKNSCLVNNINPQDFKHTLKFAYQELKEHKKHGAFFRLTVLLSPRHPISCEPGKNKDLVILAQTLSFVKTFVYFRSLIRR